MQPYIGMIIMFAGNFAPNGWALCNGQTVPISENDTLFNLIGTTYGGDGEETFNLPNLQGRLPVHMGTRAGGSTYQIGDLGGQEEVTISVNQLPQHTHNVNLSQTAGSTSIPANTTYLTTPFTAGGPNATALKLFNSNTPDTALSQVIGVTGGSQPMSIMQPYMAVNYCISLFGIFPSQT